MSAQRSAKIRFDNKTSRHFVLDAAELSHGIWSDSEQPPQDVPPQSTGKWGSESQGIGTGTEGTAIYEGQGNSSVLLTMKWDNPFVGTSSYSATVNDDTLQVTTEIVQPGNNAIVVYTLTEP